MLTLLGEVGGKKGEVLGVMLKSVLVSGRSDSPGKFFALIRCALARELVSPSDLDFMFTSLRPALPDILEDFPRVAAILREVTAELHGEGALLTKDYF